jgi:uncharacterized protein DUF3251
MTTLLRLCLRAAILVPAILGCQPQTDGGASDRLVALGDSLAALSDAVGAEVDLTPGESAYSVLRIDIGSIAVTLDALAPYGSGSRVSMTLGNLTSAGIDGLAATVSWGLPSSAGEHSVVQGHSRRLTLSNSLPSGAWTKVSFALDSVPPDQIGFLRLGEASATSIRLR